MSRLAMSWLVISAICIGTTQGCRRPDTAQVSGRVLYKDGTVPQGGVRVIQFQPASDTPAKIRKAASGEIQNDGWFEAYTRKAGDGVFVGKYDVTFTVLQDPTDSRSSLIDSKYERAATTPFHVTIEDDVSDLEFEIEPKSTTDPKQ